MTHYIKNHPKNLPLWRMYDRRLFQLVRQVSRSVGRGADIGGKGGVGEVCGPNCDTREESCICKEPASDVVLRRGPQPHSFLAAISRAGQ